MAKPPPGSRLTLIAISEIPRVCGLHWDLGGMRDVWGTAGVRGVRAHPPRKGTAGPARRGRPEQSALGAMRLVAYDGGARVAGDSEQPEEKALRDVPPCAVGQKRQPSFSFMPFDGHFAVRASSKHACELWTKPTPAGNIISPFVEPSFLTVTLNSTPHPWHSMPG